MAIQISGCTVIDNSRNITNANNMCVGTGITMIGSSGNVSIAGTLTAGGLNVPFEIISISPTDGATSVPVNSNIVIAFNQTVQKATTGIGTTAVITLRNSSGIGTVIQTIGVNSTSVSINGTVVIIDPPSLLPFITDVYVVIDAGAFTSVSTGASSPLINTYNFTTTTLDLGTSYECGFLICKSSPTRWIVAPTAAIPSRSWYCLTDGPLVASICTGCTTWFVPNCTNLKNPGYTCRNFWQNVPSGFYWSTTQAGPIYAWAVCMDNGVGGQFPATQYSSGGSRKTNVYPVPSFRTVTY